MTNICIDHTDFCRGLDVCAYELYISRTGTGVNSSESG